MRFVLGSFQLPDFSSAVPEDVEVTHRVYLDVAVGARPVGRLKIGLFGGVVPRTVRGGRALTTVTSASRLPFIA